MVRAKVTARKTGVTGTIIRNQKVQKQLAGKASRKTPAAGATAAGVKRRRSSHSKPL
jgi:hypothetical protein